MSDKTSRFYSDDAQDVGEPVSFARIDDVTIGAIRAAIDLGFDVVVDYDDDDKSLSFRAIPRGE